MDYRIARQNMVRNQILRRGIRSEKVIAALLEVPRHCFVDKGMQAQSYSDNALPLLRGQTISQPFMVAQMTELLGLEPHHKVLEIGTGSGYQAAVLATLSQHVYSIERIPELGAMGRENLQNAGYGRVHLRVGDGTLGWPEAAPFDRIVVTAGAPDMPEALFSQLAEGGLLVAPVGTQKVQSLRIVQKVQGQPEWHMGPDCVFVPLIGSQGWKEKE